MEIITCIKLEEISSCTVKLQEYIRDPKSSYTHSKLENDEVMLMMRSLSCNRPQELSNYLVLSVYLEYITLN